MCANVIQKKEGSRQTPKPKPLVKDHKKFTVDMLSILVTFMLLTHFFNGYIDRMGFEKAIMTIAVLFFMREQTQEVIKKHLNIG